MKKIVWGVVAVGLMLWSALAWVVHSLVGWGGSLASGNVDVLTPHPEAVEWLSWLAILGTDVSEWIVIGIWGLGVIFALILGFVGTRLFPSFGLMAQKMKDQQFRRA
jgi:hypothetical protein